MAKQLKGKETTYDKVKKEDPTFIEEVYTLTTEALKERVLSLTKYAMDLEEAREQDEDLKTKQEQAREAAKSHSVPLKANKLKRQLIMQILTERGKQVE